MTNEEWERQLDEVFGLGKEVEYRWASETCANGSPHPDELEYLGYTKVCEHPNHPGTWLMQRILSS